MFPKVPLDGLFARWNKVELDLGVPICDIPREAHLGLDIYGVYPDDPKRLLGWVQSQLMNAVGEFNATNLHLRCWSDELGGLTSQSAIFGCAAPNLTETGPEISLRFNIPVTSPIYFGAASGVSGSSRVSFTSEISLFSDTLLHACPLLSPRPKTFGDTLLPENLPAMLLLVPWQVQSAVILVHEFLKANPLPQGNTHIALRLLRFLPFPCDLSRTSLDSSSLPSPLFPFVHSFEYADRAIREYAVDFLAKIDSAELMELSIPLIQIMKFESYLNSPIAKLLIKRALQNTSVAYRVCYFVLFLLCFFRLTLVVVIAMLALQNGNGRFEALVQGQICPPSQGPAAAPR